MYMNKYKRAVAAILVVSGIYFSWGTNSIMAQSTTPSPSGTAQVSPTPTPSPSTTPTPTPQPSVSPSPSPLPQDAVTAQSAAPSPSGVGGTKSEVLGNSTVLGDTNAGTEALKWLVALIIGLIVFALGARISKTINREE